MSISTRAKAAQFYPTEGSGLTGRFYRRQYLNIYDVAIGSLTISGCQYTIVLGRLVEEAFKEGARRVKVIMSYQIYSDGRRFAVCRLPINILLAKKATMNEQLRR